MQMACFRQQGLASILCRCAVLTGLLAGNAVAGDLIDHNGFEACWTHAITKAQFLDAMKTAIDGVESCVPLQDLGSGVTACYTMACAGGTAVGCPVTTHASGFTGTFVAGTSEFSSAGTADNIVIPVSAPYSCSVTLSNISLTYTLDYTMTIDGNSGLYAASLDQSVLAIAPGYNANGPGACATLASSFATLFQPQVETQGAAAILALEAPTTVDESVCPLTP